MIGTRLQQVFAIVCLLTVSATAQTTLRVQPGGANLDAAFDKAAEDTSITEIILEDGVYDGSFRLFPPKDHKGDLPHLTVRAAQGATPLLRHARHVTEAEPVNEAIGLYRIQQYLPSDPQMWERETRIRYVTLATVDSVAAYPGSCFKDTSDNYLYFRTSDSAPPASHDLWLALCSKNSRAIYLRRPNVTIDGLHFADYVNHNALAIQVFDHNVTIRNCRFDNCETAVGSTPDTENIVVENCVGTDVARGIYSHSVGMVMRNNRFTKTRDRFMYKLYPQNDSAYQVYSPGAGATIEGNFCKGYIQAIFLKARAAPYIVRHNTVVDAHLAIGFSSGLKDDGVVENNILVDAKSFMFIATLSPGSKLDNNLMWRPREIGEFENSMSVIRGANRGKRNILADPRFVDPANGDYRLLPDSPAIALAGPDGRPAGAFPVASTEAAEQTKPTLSLAFAADSKPFGSTGDYTFERDPWIGGGTTHIRELSEGGIPARLTGNSTVTVRPRAFDAVGAVTQMRYTIGDGEPQTRDFIDHFKMALPETEGNHRVTFAVQNDRGVWSELAEAVIRVDRTAPQLAAVPQVHANAHGFVMHAQTDEPCLATLHYGSSPDALTNKIDTPPHVKRNWNSNDGGEWIETWTVPQTSHILGALQPEGDVVYAQMTFTDQAGLSSQSDVVKVQLTGQPQTHRVAPDGLKLQTAADLALPGDRIVIAPGTYTDSVQIRRGGVEGAPITIEADEPGTVTLDGAKRVDTLISLEHAPHVTIRSLRILYFNVAGIYAYASPHTTLDQCVSYNGEGWQSGYHSFFFWSPHTTVTNNLMIGAEYGFYFLKSPYATVLHNTCSQSMYGSASYPYSLEGTTQMYNSFVYSGNDAFNAEIAHPSILETFRSDYNNLGGDILGYHRNMQSQDPDMYEKVKAEAFTPAKYDTYIRTANKAVVGISGTRYLTMKDWREASGQDQHSIFADPGYVRPFAPIDQWDWRVKPGSPNLTVRDENGRPIGAFGAAE